MWQVTHDRWHMTHDRSLALMAWDLGDIEDLEEKDRSLNESVNDGGVCRTATPGLLIILQSEIYFLTVYTEHCTLHIIHWALNTTHHTLHTEHCTPDNTHCVSDISASVPAFPFTSLLQPGIPALVLHLSATTNSYIPYEFYDFVSLFGRNVFGHFLKTVLVIFMFFNILNNAFL